MSARDTVHLTDGMPARPAPETDVDLSDTPAALIEADREGVHLTDVLCEGRAHPLREGHDDGAARFMVSMECPGCERRLVVALCAGRVAAIRGSFSTMTCEQCGHTAAWIEHWDDVVPLASLGSATW